MRIASPLLLAATVWSGMCAAHAAVPSTMWSAFDTSPTGSALVPGRYAGERALNGQLAAADRRGNLVVVATRRDLAQPCMVVLKHHGASGAVAWRREACGDRHTWGAAVGVDVRGDVLVTGSVSGALRTMKLSGSDGAVLWDRALPAATAGFGIAVAPNGDALVAAHAASISTDVVVARHRAADGAIAWQAVVDAGFDEMPAGIAVDPEGNAIVAASYANDRGDGDWLVRKLAAASGEVLWQQTYDSGGRDIPAALAVDAAGNVAVTGASSLADGGYAARTVKYGRDGALAWDRSTGTGDSGGRAVAFDAHGAVIVAGVLQSGGSIDAGVLKYTAEGELAWTARHAGTAGGADAARAIALDPAGHVAVTGHSFSVGRPDPELFAAKFHGVNGRLMWTHLHRPAGPSPETAGHAVVEAGGHTYVVGVAQEGGPLGIHAVKVSHAVAAADVARANVQGLWWASPPGSESGWGLNLAQQGAIVFATWFTYDENGEGAWFVVPRAIADGDRYVGTLYRTQGPWFGQGFDGSKVRAIPAGAASFEFQDGDHGTFRFNVGSVRGEKAITRQVFAAPAPTCAAGGAPGALPNYQDLWWAAPAGAESGWGLNIAHQGDVLFVTWFTYGSDGEGTWLVGSRFDKTGNGTYTGVLHRTSGPPLGAARFDPAHVRSVAAGSGTLAFSDAERGTFSYTVDGVTQSKAITRQAFAEPRTVCR